MEISVEKSPEKKLKERNGKNEDELRQSELNEKIEQPQIEIAGDKQDDMAYNENGSNLNDFWLIGLFTVALILIGFSLFFFLQKSQMKNEIESVLVAQPFTENNDMMFFHLPNKLRVMIVTPNTQQNNTFICELNSVDFGNRFGIRSFRFCWNESFD